MGIKIADLLDLTAEVEVAPGKAIKVRALTLAEMIKLFLASQEVFVRMYSKAMEAGDKVKAENFAPFLLAAPDLVNGIIALSAEVDDPENVSRLPASVQLIALREVWRLSVPDPKKLSELLSEVMGQLRKLSERQENVPSVSSPQKNSNVTSQKS